VIKRITLLALLLAAVSAFATTGTAGSGCIMLVPNSAGINAEVGCYGHWTDPNREQLMVYYVATGHWTLQTFTGTYPNLTINWPCVGDTSGNNACGANNPNWPSFWGYQNATVFVIHNALGNGLDGLEFFSGQGSTTIYWIGNIDPSGHLVWQDGGHGF